MGDPRQTKEKLIGESIVGVLVATNDAEMVVSLSCGREAFEHLDGTIGYRASKFDCEVRPLKSKCCPNAVARRIARSIYEPARDKARAIAKTAAYVVSRR
jgi:hypothetical protein